MLEWVTSDLDGCFNTQSHTNGLCEKAGLEEKATSIVIDAGIGAAEAAVLT